MRWMSGQTRVCPDVDARRLAASCADYLDLRGQDRFDSMPILLDAATEVMSKETMGPSPSALIDLAVSDPDPYRVAAAIKAIVAAGDLAGAIRLVSSVARCPTDQLEKLILKSKNPAYAYTWAKMLKSGTPALRAIADRSPYYGMMFEMEFPRE